MKITSITAQQKNPNRVNIFIDAIYRFSLDIFQVTELGIRVGREYNETELMALEDESQFGKLYGRALEYCLLRPHSAKEIRDYLWRKTLTTRRQVKPSERQKAKGDYQPKIIEKSGVSKEITERVFTRLEEKGYIDDEKFANFWIENRNQRKGASRRKLVAELRQKGVNATIIEAALEVTERSDEDELAKMVAKKYTKYRNDTMKLVAYLARQGFNYDDIKTAIATYEEISDLSN